MMLDVLVQLLLEHSTISLACFIIICWSIYISYLLFKHPLSHVPGPLIRRVSNLPLLYSCYVGTEASCNAALHAKYGPIVITGPDEVDIADGAALFPIYVEKGGFRKAGWYSQFDVEGHATMFSSLDPAMRSIRSKSVMSLFATSKLRQSGKSSNAMEKCVDSFIATLKEAKAAQSNVVLDLLDLSRRFSMDVQGEYLFGQRWTDFDDPASERKRNKTSAAPYVESIVAHGGRFKFPTWFINLLDAISPAVRPSEKVATESADKVERYVRQLIAATDVTELDTFQKSLLKAGISEDETAVNMKDVIFAGTDTPSVVLSKILWHLAQQPELRYNLYTELTTDADGTLPLLQATVREGLRLSMANPTPLSRVVPPEGWIYRTDLPQTGHDDKGGAARYSKSKAYSLPAGTTVGVQMYSLHLDPKTYPDPRTFNPYRWLSSADKSDASNDGDPLRGVTSMQRMQRDMFPFGAGTRQCIGRNLALEEMTLAVRRVIERQALEGAKVVHKELPIREWFNSEVFEVGGVLISFP